MKTYPALFILSMILCMTANLYADLPIQPTQPGFKISIKGRSLIIAALFEGELSPHFKFMRQSVTNAPL